MKYMLILFLLMMENISSNVRIIVYLKTVSMIRAMSVPYFSKNMGAKESILEIRWLYKAITYMQTEEFSEYS